MQHPPGLTSDGVMLQGAVSMEQCAKAARDGEGADGGAEFPSETCP